LTRTLHKSLEEIEQLPLAEIKLQMAYDLTMDSSWVQSHKQRLALAASRQLSPEEKAKAFKAAMGRQDGNDK